MVAKLKTIAVVAPMTKIATITLNEIAALTITETVTITLNETAALTTTETATITLNETTALNEDLLADMVIDVTIGIVNLPTMVLLHANLVTNVTKETSASTATTKSHRQVILVKVLQKKKKMRNQSLKGMRFLTLTLKLLNTSLK